MNFSKYALLFIFLLALNPPASAQLSQWKSFQSPQQINDLADNGNELLLATDAGLVVLNKTTLEKEYFNTSNSNLPSDHIQAITRSPSGQFWIGTYDVILARFDGNNFTDITIPGGPGTVSEDTKLYDLEVAPNGDFWVGTTIGAMHRQGQNWTIYDASILNNIFDEIWDIEINSNGDVYLAGMSVHHYQNGIWHNMTDTTQLHSYYNAELFLAANGDLYFNGHTGHIGHFDGSQWWEYDSSSSDDFDLDLEGSALLNFAEDPEGKVYLNTADKGIFKLIANTWTHQANPLTESFENKTSYFYIDPQGNQWLNYNIQLSVNKNGVLETSKISQHSVEKNSIHKIRQDQQGTLYFINTNNSVATCDAHGNWSSLALPAIGSGDRINDLVVFEVDDIWMSTNSGLYHFDGDHWAFHEILHCYHLTYDAQKRLFVGSENGLFIIENGNFTHYTTDNSPLSASSIFGLGVDRDNNLWVAAYGYYIHKISGNSWTTYPLGQHPQLHGIFGEFHFDKNGHVWIPSRGNGAVRFDGNTWTNFNPSNSPMPHTDVFAIESDADGKVYFSHGAGITTLQENIWKNVPEQELPMNDFYISDMEFSEDGTLWWGGHNSGLYANIPQAPTSNLKPIVKDKIFKIFPNPGNDYVIIDFEIDAVASVRAFIYNNLGQEISSIDFGILSPGKYQNPVNLAHFSKGIYTVQLNVNGISSTHKLILL